MSRVRGSTTGSRAWWQCPGDVGESPGGWRVSGPHHRERVSIHPAPDRRAERTWGEAQSGGAGAPGLPPDGTATPSAPLLPQKRARTGFSFLSGFFKKKEQHRLQRKHLDTCRRHSSATGPGTRPHPRARVTPWAPVPWACVWDHLAISPGQGGESREVWRAPGPPAPATCRQGQQSSPQWPGGIPGRPRVTARAGSRAEECPARGEPRTPRGGWRPPRLGSQGQGTGGPSVTSATI